MYDPSATSPNHQPFCGRIAAASQFGGPASCQAYDGSEGDRGSSEGHPVLDRGPGLQPTTDEVLSTAGVAWGTVDQAGVVRTKLSSVLRAAEAMKAEAPSSAEASEGLSHADLREPEESGVGPSGPSLDTSDTDLRRNPKSKGKRGRPRKGAKRQKPAVSPVWVERRELLGHGELLGGEVHLEALGMVRPDATYRLRRGEQQEWLTGLYQQAEHWANKEYGMDSQLAKFLADRAQKVPNCGKTWAVPKCGHCGHENGAKAYVVDPCHSSGCPVCARTKAQPWRAAAFEYVKEHPAARQKGKVSRVYHLDTYTVPLGETVSVPELREQLALLRKGVKNVWRKVARFMPRSDDGEYGGYPGVCEDAGMLMGIEVGPSGNIHAHVLRYGPAHPYEDLRRAYQEVVPGAKVIDHKLIKGEGAELAGAICEAVKYSVQGTVHEEGEFTHPMVVILSEIALFNRRRIECYGSMRGMKGRAEEIRRKEKAEQEIEGTVVAEPCSECGHNEWVKVTINKPAYWVPEGWSRKKKRAPPEGCET